MLSVPIDGQVQSRLIPPTFVEDNISDMFKAVDAGHNIVVTAVDEYGNRTSITTPDNVNHDMLGRSLEFRVPSRTDAECAPLDGLAVASAILQGLQVGYEQAWRLDGSVGFTSRP